jgi:photosystem II stability/assembly factor-like uncharacterized protein
MKMSRRAAFALILVAMITTTAGVLHSQTPQISGEQFRDLRYRYIGPVGNRVSAVAGIPGQPNVYYVGAASGGIWKTADGGAHWESVFDTHEVQSIGSLAIAPSDSNIVWAGTGEVWIRSNISIGNGIYKSVDAGMTWSSVGLEKTGRIGRIVIDPKNPDVVLVCALGHAYGPQPERGVFRTTNGGRSWERVLFVDENTGCSDIAMDPDDAGIVFAGMWQFEMHTWGSESGGPGSGLFMSRDGGATWNRLSGRGLPTRPVGKIAVAIANSDSKRIYAMIETGDGVPWKGQETDRGTLWRSDDRGETWKVVSYDHKVNGRAHYFSRMAVEPNDENELYFPTGSFARSVDGGATIKDENGLRNPGGDNHDIWIDPKDSNRLAVGNDFGISISVNRGSTWMRIQLPIAQMYHVTVDNEVPYNVYGNRQDGPSFRGPSNSRLGEGGWGIGYRIPRSLWISVGGGESGWATPDPVDKDIVWSSSSPSGTNGGAVARYEVSREQSRSVEVWPDEPRGWPAADLKYRFHWTMPLTISPHDHNTVYVGSQYVHRTTNGGQSWEVISPDLTLNDKSRQQSSGGLAPDNIGPEYAGVVFAIAESPLESGLIWAGTNDGLVHLTRDAGKTWTNVTKNIPNLPPWGTVSNIEPSRFRAGTAYLTVDFHQVNNRDPFVYKTGDYGRTWEAITNGIPRSVLSYAHCIREDPVRPGLLYLGTENALYVSFDDGENWISLQLNLPPAPVYWIAIQEHFNDLVVATYGRGYWILDDLSPLQQLSTSVAESTAYLFPPRVAYRFRAVAGPANHSSNHADDPTVGHNPDYGADINYYLRSASSEAVTIRILDANGQPVRELEGTKHAGINRINWDLRTESLGPWVAMRTSPTYAPEVHVAPHESWGQPLPDGGSLVILSPPGSYTVELAVGDQKFTRPLIVKKDPHSAGSEADIQAQVTMLFDLRKELETAVTMVDKLEVLRSQLYARTSALSGHDTGTEDIKRAAAEFDRQMTDVEGNLVELKLTAEGQDTSRWPSRLVSKLLHLAEGLGNSDFRPTDQQVAVQGEFQRQVGVLKDRFDQILSKDLVAFNAKLRKRGIENISVKAP